MMQLRRTISLLAALGLLAQAAAFQRHSQAMLGGARLAQLSADLARICHGGKDTAPAGPHGPEDLDLACPICSSLGAALIDLAALQVFCALPGASSEGRRKAAAHAPRLALRPPVRAPPLRRA